MIGFIDMTLFELRGASGGTVVKVLVFVLLQDARIRILSSSKKVHAHDFTLTHWPLSLRGFHWHSLALHCHFLVN